MKLRSIAALTGRNASSIGALRKLLDEIKTQELKLPPNCSVTYELESIEIVDSLLKPARPEAALEAFYREFSERHGVRPTAVEVFHESFNPRGNSERSWLGFVSRMSGLSQPETRAFSQSRAFLESIEKTETSHSHKIALLLAMISANSIPGEIEIDKLVEHVARIAARYLKVRDDLSIELGDAKGLRRALVENPIRNFVEAEGSGDGPFFRFDSGRLSTTFEVGDVESFRDLLREILDWRLAEYLNRRVSGGPNVELICRANRVGDDPILLLPSEAKSLNLEQELTGVQIGDETYEVSIEKNAICIVRKPDGDVNLLPELLRHWFGDDVGQPERSDRVRLKRTSSGFEMEALRIAAPQGLQVWSRYLRETIPPAFGLTFSEAIWNVGFVARGSEVFLLVTLAKQDMNTDHRYVDHFLSDREFAWQSQKRTKRVSKNGQSLRNHRAEGKRVHLFVRATKKIGSKPAPFIYCGEVDFISWEGDAPISIKWRLREAVPPPFHSVLGVPS